MNKLKRMLKRHEGKRHFAYRCSEGKLTIGVGRCIDENGGIGLSEEEIDYLLDATEFLDSKWHSQVGFRAKELAEMIRTGDYPEK